MIFKIRFRTSGAHTHFRLFAGETVGALGYAGSSLVLKNEEFNALRAILERGAEPDPVLGERFTVIFQDDSGVEVVT